MDVPVALGIAITFVASTGATFQPSGAFGHEVYFDSLTMFVSFLLGARYLELRARHRAAEALESSLARLPDTAWRVLPDGSTVAISVARVVAGDLLRVPMGQAFPADGITEQGHTAADEALLTGESAPVDKPVGAAVVAGSTNLSAPVLLRVQRVGGDTRLEAIVSMMKSAMAQRPAAAQLADRWAGPFLWAVLLLAAGAAAVWSVIDPPRALWVAVSVLIVTCPCALSIAAPATLVAAARGLARRGVLLQRLDALERLAAVQQVFFDKTGTLTEDRLQLAATQRLTAGESLFASDAEALACGASLAAWSSHPVAQALVGAAGPAASGAGWAEVEELPGRGLRARDAQGRLWRLGSASWAGVAGGAAGTEVWLGCDGQPVARYTLEETLRPGSAEAVHALQAAGLRVTLLSGDAGERAASLAARLGITEVLASATPEAKLAAVAQAQAEGRRVAMVGDGINDAPVLARADVSLAMGQGALVSRSQADAVLTSSNLFDLVRARDAARQAVRIVRQNLAWAAAYNATSIPLALAGWLPPWAAGLGMAGSSLLVIFNALRAAR
jgi:P-type Cu2+ transporter